MQLTVAQLRQLQKMQEYRATPPTIRTHVASNWRPYLYLLIVGGIGIAFFLWAGWPVASALFAGMVFATFVRDLGWFRRMIQSWPLLQEITDWNKVDELIKQRHGPAA